MVSVPLFTEPSPLPPSRASIDTLEKTGKNQAVDQAGTDTKEIHHAKQPSEFVLNFLPFENKLLSLSLLNDSQLRGAVDSEKKAANSARQGDVRSFRSTRYLRTTGG